VVSNIFLNFKLKKNNRFYLKQQIFKFFLNITALYATMLYAHSIVKLCNLFNIDKHERPYTQNWKHRIYWPYVWIWASGLCAHASNYLVADWLKVEKKVESWRNFKNRSKGYAKYFRAHVGYTARSYDAKIASQLGFLYLEYSIFFVFFDHPFQLFVEIRIFFSTFRWCFTKNTPPYHRPCVADYFFAHLLATYIVTHWHASLNNLKFFFYFSKKL